MSDGRRAGGPRLSPAKAALLDRWRRGAAPAPAAAGIPRRPTGKGAGPPPLSPAQRRILFMEQFEPGTAAYNLCFCARVGGRLDPGTLAASLADLVERHEALRTVVGSAGGEPYQAVDAGAVPALDTVDLRHLDAGAGLDAALERVDAAVQAPFDLERGPLGRVLLCQLADGDLLAIVVHHLVADGWSLGVALRDLSVAYQARAAGRAPARAPLPVQYGDVAAWQLAADGGPAWQADLAWWRGRLEGAPPLELPTDRPRPPVLSQRGDWLPLRLGRRRSEALRALARETGTTLYMVLVAALLVLLRRHSGQRDLTVGALVANRPHPDTYDLVGNFANLVALRTVIDGDPTFRELLASVRETCVGGFAHQAVPFERLVQELRPERDLSRSVLAQVLFVMQPPTTELRFAGLALEPVEVGPRATRADLELHLWDQPEVSGRLAFSTDLFEAATVERLADRFLSLLDALVADPDRRLSSLTLVEPAERELLAAWGRGKAAALPRAGIHELIERQAARAGETTAVLDGGERIGYGELNRRANRLARHLRALGVGPETRVAICLERSAELLVALLGVLKAGGAYVPLDPGYPAERLAFMVADAAAPVLLTSTALRERVASPGVTAACLDDPAERAAIDRLDGGDLGLVVHPEQLAYVLYTSGSTGRPKGVQIPHRALTNLALAIAELPGLGAGEVVAATTTVSFDVAALELLVPLTVGGAVALASSEEARDLVPLAGKLAERGVTVVQATPTAWRLLLGAGTLDGRRIRALCGGEPLPAALAAELATNCAEAWNLYGPTETTIWSSAARLARPGDPERDAGGGAASGVAGLGVPLANTRLRVVDELLAEVPIGVAGELVIGGAGVARGYLGRPGLTADRFVPDPFAPEPGARLYRTGDLARYRGDGTLEFLGRADGQVKLRGHRIELGEVEATLAAHPAVRQAAAAVHELAPGDARLVAYVVPAAHVIEADQRSRLPSLLSRHARERLPEYMVPSSFEVMEALPATPAGKLDRGRLPAPSRRRRAGGAHVAPRTPLEAEIAELTGELLGIDQVGVDDDFFELGGHSLLATRIITELRRRHGVELPLQRMFLTPTVAHLASLVDEELEVRRRLDGGGDARLRERIGELGDEAVDALLADLLAND